MGKEPVKIMYLIDVYKDPYAGTERQLYNLVRGLDKNRFMPSLTLFRPSAYITENGFLCPVETLFITRLLSLVALYRLIRFAQRLRRENYRIVHIFFNDPSISAPVILKLAGLKVLISRRDMGYWYNSVNLAILRFNRHFLDGAIVNSNAVREITHEKERIPLDRIHVVHNGYNAVREDDTGKALDLGKIAGAGTRIIGLVANIRPIKRIDVLIRAFRDIRQEFHDTALVIVGDGDPAELQKLAADLGIGDHVHFTGKQQNTFGIIRQFDVAVLCSESEGFSNTIIEYMQAGVPVVATATGGNTELVEDGFTGLLAPVNDSAALAENIGRILANRIDRDRLTRDACRKVRETCNMEKMIAGHMKIYESL